MCVKSKFKLKFSSQQWEEIEALGFEGFTPEQGQAMTRDQWVAVGHMALGKAERIEAGEYGEPEDDMEDNEEWVNDLRAVAGVIFNEFKSGDGKI